MASEHWYSLHPNCEREDEDKRGPLLRDADAPLTEKGFSVTYPSAQDRPEHQRGKDVTHDEQHLWIFFKGGVIERTWPCDGRQPLNEGAYVLNVQGFLEHAIIRFIRRLHALGWNVELGYTAGLGYKQRFLFIEPLNDTHQTQVSLADQHYVQLLLKMPRIDSVFQLGEALEWIAEQDATITLSVLERYLGYWIKMKCVANVGPQLYHIPETAIAQPLSGFWDHMRYRTSS